MAEIQAWLLAAQQPQGRGDHDEFSKFQYHKGRNIAIPQERQICHFFFLTLNWKEFFTWNFVGNIK